MSKLIIMYDAKCKHCKYLFRYNVGKRARHKCANPQSNRFENNITLKDESCNEFKL